MTQPTLTRRGFLATLAALPLAGQALDKLAAIEPELPSVLSMDHFYPMNGDIWFNGTQFCARMAGKIVVLE